MITVKNDGDLGNQMFQYAFLRSHAEKHGLDWFFYDHWQNNAKYNQAYNDIFQLFDLPNGTVNEIQKLNRVQIPDMYQDIGSEDSTLYEGWFQSEKFFNSHYDDVVKWFTPKGVLLSSGKKVFNDLLKYFNCSLDEICVLHYRGTSYRRLGWDLPKEWYDKSINHMLENSNVKHFVIFTDDPSRCKKLWGDKYVIISENRLLDYSIMFNFTNFIVSPSSFSFWTAWISGENVIAPEFWLGHPQDEWKPSEDIKITSREWMYIKR